MQRLKEFRLAGRTLVLALGASACGGDAALSIQIVAPRMAELDPTRDERLTAMTLVGEERERVLADEPFGPGDVTATLPDLPLGFRGPLRLDLLDAGRRVLGLGRATDVHISLDQSAADRVVRFHVRKPLAYVGSAKSISVLDITRSRSEDFALTPVPLSRVTALGTPRNGRSVLVATDAPAELYTVDTQTHEVSRLMELPSPVRRIAVDASDRSALLVHASGTTLLSLEPGRTPIVTTGIITSDPGRGTVAAFARGGDSIFVVGNTGAAYGGTACAALSTFQRRSTKRSSPAIDLPFVVSDIDVHPTTGNPIVASPCRNAVIEIDPETGAELGLVVDMPGVSEVSVVRNNIVALGSRTGASGVQELQAKIWPGDTSVTIPWPKTRFQYRSDDPLTRIIIEISPWRAEIRDLAVGPELDRVVMAVRFDYRATSWCDGATAISWGHLTVSLTTGTVVSYVETKRDTVTRSCEITSGVPPTAEHEPTSVAILFGGS